jgi:uncharacterized protein YlaI
VLPALRVLVLVPLLGAVCLAADGPERELFDGKSLSGWVVEGGKTYKDGDKERSVWEAKGGMISCMTDRGGFGFLRYEKQQFADFRLGLEYRFAKPDKRRGNSGIGIRTVPFDPRQSTKTRPSLAAYEIQLLDDADRPAAKGSTASLYRYVAPSEQAAKPAPEWNRIEIECVGPRIKITLNGKKVVDVDQTTIKELKDKPLRGYICLQNHGSKVDFRNIKVREINAKK